MQGNESVRYTSGYHREKLPRRGWRRIEDEAAALRQIREEEELPDRIRELKALYYELNPGLVSEAERFYRQARFMADYEDGYEFKGLFRRYFPTYSAMTGSQLRGYFGFRTRFRAGRADPDPPISFAYVYAYELIHGIGVTKEGGYEELKRLRRIYGDKDIAFKQGVSGWLRDYVVYYNMGREAAKECFDLGPGEALSALLKEEGMEGGEIPKAMIRMSSYPVLKSPLYKKDPELMEEVLSGVWTALSEALSGMGSETLQGRCFGPDRTTEYRMFRSAVFFDHLDPGEYVYEVSPAERYRHDALGWHRQIRGAFNGSLEGDRKSQELGRICRETDRLLRLELRLARELTAKQTDPIYTEVIQRVIAQILAQRREAARPKITIDMSKLGEIRRDADEIRDALLVEEQETEAGDDKTSDTKTGDIETAVGASTSSHPVIPGWKEEETFLLHSLLYNLPWKEHLREHHQLASVLAEGINDHCMELFQDTVIEFEEEQPVLVEDYITDLKEMLPE